MFEVEFYTTKNGKEPVAEFLDSLDCKMNAKLLGLMELLEEKGTELREPYSASLGNKAGILGNSITEMIAHHREALLLSSLKSVSSNCHLVFTL